MNAWYIAIMAIKKNNAGNTPIVVSSSSISLDKTRFNMDEFNELIPNIDYLVYRKCTPDWQIIEDEFPRWNLTYVIEGSSRYTIDGKDYNLNAGDILCLPPGHIRTAKTWKDQLMVCFAVNFDLTNLQGKAAQLPFPLITNIGEQADIISLFHEMVFIWVERQPLYRLKCRALLLLVLHRLFEVFIFNTASSVMDFRIQKITRYIATHYSEKLTVQKMAALLGLNPVYFGALFKQETGMSMKRYLLRIRIQNAENMLRSGEYKVAEIAERCGYNDIVHFYKQFRQVYGLSPSEYIPKKSTY